MTFNFELSFAKTFIIPLCKYFSSLSVSYLIIIVDFEFSLALISIFSNVYAVTGEEVLNSTQATELVEIKESAKNTLAEYIDKYGSTPFGVARKI